MYENINAVLIMQTINDCQSLYILIESDGMVRRKGSGIGMPAEDVLFIGVGTRDLFQHTLSLMNPEWLQRGGLYKRQGEPSNCCEVTVGFRMVSGKEVLLRFQYGGDATVIPHDIMRYAELVVAATNPWYEEQKMVARRS